MINDIASILLWLIVAIFLLHVIEGNAQEWVKSKFKSGVLDSTTKPQTFTTVTPVNTPKPTGTGTLAP